MMFTQQSLTSRWLMPYADAMSEWRAYARLTRMTKPFTTHYTYTCSA